jgi:hypothetical protein
LFFLRIPGFYPGLFKYSIVSRIRFGDAYNGCRMVSYRMGREGWDRDLWVGTLLRGSESASEGVEEIWVREEREEEEVEAEAKGRSGSGEA